MAAIWAIFILFAAAAAPPPNLTIDYPAQQSIFPPDFAAPTFLFRDASTASRWEVRVKDDPAIHAATDGPFMQIGAIDPRCVSSTNELPRLTPQQAASHTWVPDAATWAAIKRQPRAVIVLTGYDGGRAVSTGEVTIHTSADPVGAPIFYRDVPLMPSETAQGVIKPLAASAVPLIAWRLRNVAEPSSRVVMEGIHSCANCHSASLDGKTLGLDVDGPRNDKGLYALVPIARQMAIRNEDVIAWSTFRGKLGGPMRVGFMSQVSPDGRYVVTTINDPGEPQPAYQRQKIPKDLVTNYYVINFKDYRFLQVFYPTRGILAWYSRETNRLEPLPGADDTRYVHTAATWSPDGKYLVFARAEARDAYVPGMKPALEANDPNERQIRYDLYRIPFNGGKGGTPERIEGASANGMSNSFPKISPDGKWIVWVQCRNGQLMRPDSRLYIVPASGGKPRLMRANTPLMNSWHSFSPNGRWLVFSSKARSPYTQMYLTHIDADGNDSPAVLIENSTAANRAVNIPEFLNIAPDGIDRIDAPATDYFRMVDTAADLDKQGRHVEAIAEWRRAAAAAPAEAAARFNLATSLAASGQLLEAVAAFEQALAINPEYPEALNNLGSALVRLNETGRAVEQFAKALRMNPEDAGIHNNLGAALAQVGRLAEAIEHFSKAVELAPESVDARNNLSLALNLAGRRQEAVAEARKAAALARAAGNAKLAAEIEARIVK